MVLEEIFVFLFSFRKNKDRYGYKQNFDSSG